MQGIQCPPVFCYICKKSYEIIGVIFFRYETAADSIGCLTMVFIYKINFIGSGLLVICSQGYHKAFEKWRNRVAFQHVLWDGGHTAESVIYISY